MKVQRKTTTGIPQLEIIFSIYKFWLESHLKGLFLEIWRARCLPISSIIFSTEHSFALQRSTVHPWHDPYHPLFMASISQPTFKKFRPAVLQTWSRKEVVSRKKKVEFQRAWKTHGIKVSFRGQHWPALTISGPTSDQNGVCHIHSIMRLYARTGRGAKSAEPSPCSASVDLGLASVKQLKPPVIGAGSCLPHCPTSYFKTHCLGRRSWAASSTCSQIKWRSHTVEPPCLPWTALQLL